MSDGPVTILEVSGGSAGLEASYDAMRSLAETYDAAGDRMRGMARVGGQTMTDEDLLESSVLSPVTAMRAEAAVLAASTGPDGILVESAYWELDAIAIRGSVSLFERTDRAQHDSYELLDYIVGRQVGAVLPYGVTASAVPLGVALGLGLGPDQVAAPLEDAVTAHPELVQHLVNGGGGLLAGLSGGLLPTLTTNDAADVLGDLYPNGHPDVGTPDGMTIPGTRPQSVEDLLDHLSQVAALSHGADSPANGTIEIQTITSPAGQVVHIVNLPGADDLGTLPWTADDDVRDMGTNLQLLAGEDDDYHQGILEAMHRAGVRPDDPVLVVGHSQGGMEAAAILSGDSGYNVTDVVTAGSPTAQVGSFPEGSHVLSLEQRGDLVPLLDGEPNPPSVEQTTVVVDANPSHGIAAHHGYDVYVDGAAAVDASRHPSVVASIDSLHQHGYLGAGGTLTSQVFQITRHPG